MTEPTVFVTHRNCPDGAACQVCWKTINNNPDDIFLTFDPGNIRLEPELYRNRVIVFADLAPTPDQANEICRLAKTVTVFDHHITVKRQYDRWTKRPANFSATLDMNECGASLLAKTLRAPNHLLPMIDLIKQVDLHKPDGTPLSKAFPFWMASHEPTVDTIEKLVPLAQDATWREQLPSQVTPVKDAILKIVRDQSRKMQEVVLASKPRGVAIQLPFSLSTIAADIVLTENSDVDYCAFWSLINPQFVSVSLRSHRVDVEEIARFYGGGGHRLAAGFRISIFDFLKGMKT